MKAWWALLVHFPRIADAVDERLAARRYMRRSAKASEAWQKSDRYKQIKACSPHPNRERIESAWEPLGARSERCLDCGMPIVTIPTQALDEP